MRPNGVADAQTVEIPSPPKELSTGTHLKSQSRVLVQMCIRDRHCYGEAATFVFGVWASGMDPDGTLHWNLPDRRKSYYDERCV